MLIAAIVGHEDKSKTASLINSILSLSGKKVGIIDSKSLVDLGSIRMRGYIQELEKNKTDILLLKIDISDIDKDIFDYIHFDIMIYTDKADVLIESGASGHKNFMRRYFSLLDEKGIAIMNVDDNELLKLLEGMEQNIITYGFNSKASITTSSIGDVMSKDNFMCCLQRTITTKNGMQVEPQEYRIRAELNGNDAYNVLAAATFAIVNGIDLNSLNYNNIKN